MHQRKVKKCDVILTEDDADDVLIFALALEQAKLTINFRHALNGEMLFSLLEDGLPDMIFLDIQMPGKNGINSLLEIRSNPVYKEIPVIIYTSFMAGYFIESAYQAGANLFLYKGQSLADMAKQLKGIFTRNWKKNILEPGYSQLQVNN